MEIQRRALKAWSALIPVTLVALAACGGTEAPALPDPPEAITRKILLLDVKSERDQAIEALRSAAGLSAAEAAALLDSLPGVVATGLSHERADAMANKLRLAGMTTQIRREESE